MMGPAQELGLPGGSWDVANELPHRPPRLYLEKINWEI